MKKLLIVFLLIGVQGFAQFHKMDSVGNFYVIDYKLVWQKWYDIDDKVAFDRMLKSNDFTSDLDILKFTTSTKTKAYRLVGNNLPEYAQHDYEAFLSVDYIKGRYRVSIKQIIFPDFVEKIYYNGHRVNDPRGTLEQYNMRKDGQIKRTTGTMNVLYTFDSAFSQIFDPMAGESFE